MKGTVHEEEKKLAKRWVDTWKFITGPELARLKRGELRALTDEEALGRVGSVMNSRTKDRWIRPDRRESSGLIEQQRLFRRFPLSR